MVNRTAAPSLRILVVDDEVSVRQILTEFLTLEGHETTTAADGIAALEAFHQSSWDMIFTDRAMPRMNGDELAAAVKLTRPTLPVVMITGFVDPARDYLSEPRTVDVLVRKPFTFAAIREAIDEAASRYPKVESFYRD